MQEKFGIMRENIRLLHPGLTVLVRIIRGGLNQTPIISVLE